MSQAEYREALRKRHADAYAAAKAILDRATAEHRDLRPDEASKADELIEKARNANEQLARMDDQEARAAEADRLRAPYAADLLGYAGRGELRAGFAALGETATYAFESSPGFGYRALQSQGGSAVADSFFDSVSIYLRDASPMFDPALANVISRSSGAPLVVPRLTADVAFGGTVVPEAGVINVADPTISALRLTPYKFASISYWSAELGQDTDLDLESLVAESAARDIAYDAGTLLTLGTGVVQPYGIVTRATNGGTAVGGGTAVPGGDTFIAWQDYATLYGSVPVPAQNKGTWMVSPAMYVKMLKWRDLDGNPVMQTGLASAPSTVFGRPVVTNPAMAAPGSATKPILFGDLSKYYVASVQPIRVELSRDFRYQTDEVAVKVVVRVDADLIDTGAVAVMTCANS